MKQIFYFLITLILFSTISYGKEKEKRDMLYGQRFGIQVSSEINPVSAYKKYPIYRPYAKPFLYQTRVEICETPKVNCTLEKRYRLIIGLYKTKKEAEQKLKEFKSKDSDSFKEAFVQLVVE